MVGGDDILKLPTASADARVAYGSDPNQFGEIRIPGTKGPFPVVMNIHGGYWRAKYDLTHAAHLCAALTAKGLATWNVEYRRVGNPGSGWPGTFEDIRNAFRFISYIGKHYNFELSKILVMGHSAGGQLALCMAGHEPSVKRALSLAGVVDLQQAWELHLSNNAVVEFLGGKPSDVPEHYREADPIRLSIDQATIQWLIHGAGDDGVPRLLQPQLRLAEKAARRRRALSGNLHRSPFRSDRSTLERLAECGEHYSATVCVLNVLSQLLLFN